MRGTPLKVGAVALVIGVLAGLRLLVFADWDPSVFVAFGEDDTENLAYAQNLLGRDVVTREHQGHDGKFFFIQANDPWILEPEDNAVYLDRPVYRSQRMLYPVLAGGLGFFNAETVLWGLLIVNILMLGVGTWAVSSIAVKHRGSPWLGLAFALNIGLLSEMFVDGAGITAFALACLGAWAMEEERWVIAAAAFAGAVLSREVMAVFVASIAVMWFMRRRRIPWRIGIAAACMMVAWGAYIRIRLGTDIPGDQVNELTLVPFSGMIEALTNGHSEPIDFLVTVVFLVLMVIVPYRAWHSKVYLTWGAAGFAVLAPFLSFLVWQKSWDISRALAPLVTAFVLEMFLARDSSGVTDQSPAEQIAK